MKRADEVVNIDLTVEELRARLRQGKIYAPEKVEQSLANFFRIPVNRGTTPAVRANCFSLWALIPDLRGRLDLV